jgi:methyl-accepting chemotaxis protein
MTILNRLRLGQRLAAAFGAVVALLLVIMASALSTASRQGAAAERMTRAQVFGGLMKDAKYAAADFNGWQTAYAFDAHRGVGRHRPRRDRRHVSDTAISADQIASNVSTVALAAQQTTQGVSQAQEATAELARMSGELRILVAQFKYG